MPSPGPWTPSAAAPAAEVDPLERLRSDTSAACSCHTSSVAVPGGEITVVRVHGDVDLSTQPVLESALDQARRGRPAHLVVDLAGVRFCSVRGLSLLARAPDGPPPHYLLSGVAPRTERVLRLLGPPDTLPECYPSARVAVVAALVRQHERYPDDRPAPRPAPPLQPWSWDGDDRSRDVAARLRAAPTAFGTADPL